MIILDMSKAFDSVDQKLMISKLQDAGASSSCTEWFRSYFSGRQQVVRINSALSEPLPIVSGIPQGVHWHLCFLVYTAISRKAVGKNVHAVVTVLEGNMGYDQYTVPDTVGVEPSFVSVSANKRPWSLVPYFQIFLKNRELKIFYNTFRECRVHFVRQPFSK